MSNVPRELMRRKVLADICDRLSDDDKRTLIQAMERDRDWSEISQSLQRQEAKIDDVSRKIGRHPFATDLFSNVLGNGITDGLMWLGRALFRKL